MYSGFRKWSDASISHNLLRKLILFRMLSVTRGISGVYLSKVLKKHLRLRTDKAIATQGLNRSVEVSDRQIGNKPNLNPFEFT